MMAFNHRLSFQDHNVPNALMFIDKYTQIFRILLPIVTCLESLEDGMSVKNPALLEYITKAFGSPDGAKKAILCDFFRHGFDGSGMFPAKRKFSKSVCLKLLNRCRQLLRRWKLY
jgi:hypothetical protein